MFGKVPADDQCTSELLINEETGESKFRDFLRSERQMAALFEKFVRNFYKREQRIFRVKAERILWQDVEADEASLSMLPSMKTDVSLESKTRKLVIDTKYYGEALNSYYGHESVRSAHLYQIFAYLKNLQIQGGECRELEGMLLYPTVGVSLDLRYRIQGHSVRVATVDLNADWQAIHKRLMSLLVREPER